VIRASSPARPTKGRADGGDEAAKSAAAAPPGGWADSKIDTKIGAFIPWLGPRQRPGGRRPVGLC